MENEIVVALISSATSLFVAFGALWQSMRVANKQSVEVIEMCNDCFLWVYKDGTTAIICLKFVNDFTQR